MKLTERGIADTHAWKGYALPKFDRAKMIAATKKNPTWIHFGAGNIFRAFQAMLAQELLEKNLTDTGIIVAEGFDLDIIDKAYRPYDNLSLLVTLKSDGSITKTVAASVAESYKCDPSFPDDWNALAEIFRSKSLALVTFTITEKGYAVKNSDGNFLPAYCADFEADPDKAKMFLSRLCALLYGRYLHADKHPVALVSTDNCSHNGEKLQAAVRAIAGEWQKRGFVDEGFIDYISSPESVSFPWSMIDKITPRPDAGVQAQLKADGFEDAEIIVTDKHTYTASFVNAESPQYLVIEDAFPNGRPPLEKAGVYFTTRDTVNKVERMKVCTCLNPLHTALAIYGCLLGYTLIADEMKDAELNTLVHRIGYDEGLPVVTDPKIIDPKKFIDEVVTVRIPNPFMPDTPQRIACDTSQKLSIRFGETIKAYAADPALGTHKLKYIPLVLAGWCRYLMALDDEGKKFELSPDPLLGRVCPFVEKIELGRTYTAEALDGFLHGLLSDASLFGVDLYAAGLAPLVLEYFGELTAGKGAVRAALKKHIR